MTPTGLTTDFYELTMAQGYFYSGKREPAVFDMFFRSNPFDSGFSLFAGLCPLISYLHGLRFTGGDISYLDSTGLFRKEFLDYLSDFRFRGDLYAVPEGSVVFPKEPLIRVHADFIEAQVIESLLLNVVNFQTLIATKSARVYLASGKGTVLEFGLRRAQGLDGAMSAARAAYIGGAAATSNTAAGKELGIPAKGTMAHSWVLAFDSELEAFEAYAGLYPDSTIFLIDTYDTLGSGMDNTIAAGKKLRGQGKSFGVRLDSGDLLLLSRKVRRRLDDEGFGEAKIAVSNELDEWEIERLIEEGAPIDLWGVGTHLVTGGRDSSLTGVYKLAARGRENKPVMKISEEPEKSTNPGIKQIFRFFDDAGTALRDCIGFEAEEPASEKGTVRPLLRPYIKNGVPVSETPPLNDIRSFALAELERFPPGLLRPKAEIEYPVSLSKQLESLKSDLIRSNSAGA